MSRLVAQESGISKLPKFHAPNIGRKSVGTPLPETENIPCIESSGIVYLTQLSPPVHSLSVLFVIPMPSILGTVVSAPTLCLPNKYTNYAKP